MSHETLQSIWFILIAVLWIGFFVLEGFDFGVGLVLPFLIIWIFRHMVPGFPVMVPLWALLSATGIAIITGLVFGVMPARRAAKLDPVQALSRR